MMWNRASCALLAAVGFSMLLLTELFSRREMKLQLSAMTGQHRQKRQVHNLTATKSLYEEKTAEGPASPSCQDPSSGNDEATSSATTSLFWCRRNHVVREGSNNSGDIIINAPADPYYAALPEHLGKSVVKMVDRPSRLMIIGTPKGGATLVTQLMLRRLNLTETAQEYDRWIHRYRLEVYRRQPDHRPVECRRVH